MLVTLSCVWVIRCILSIYCSDIILWLQVMLCKSSINKKENIVFHKCRIISYILNRKIMITIVPSSFFWTLRIALFLEIKVWNQIYTHIKYGDQLIGMSWIRRVKWGNQISLYEVTSVWENGQSKQKLIKFLWACTSLLLSEIN